MRLTHVPVLLATVISLGAAPSTDAAMNLEARRLGFAASTHAPGDAASLVLTYLPTGSPGTLRDVRVDVEIGTNPVTKVAYRIREITIPQGDREFHMGIDLAKLGIREGTYDVVAIIDGNDAFPESNESDNRARASLVVVAPRTGSTAPPAPVTGSAAARALAPTSARVVAQTTCSLFEREWSAPEEIGYHPGYGQASLVLEFDHPMSLLRTGERVRSASLRLVGDVAGRPFAELGALQVTARTKGARSSRCPSLPDARMTQVDFDGDVSIDLARALRDAETVAPECAETLQVILSFPETRTPPREVALVRLAPRGASVEVEIGR